MKLRKKIVFALVGILLSVWCSEGALTLLAWISPRVALILGSPSGDICEPSLVIDKRLGYRPKPFYPGHDSKGWRNPRVPAKAFVVALGDSQTYGFGVGPQDAWPRQLESMLKQSVYNMGCGGYGPVHSLLLWDEAVSLQPHIIIEGLYAGNDLYDCFDIVYKRNQLPELKSADTQFQERVLASEKALPIAELQSRVYLTGVTNASPMKEPSSSVSRIFSLRGILSRHSRLYGLLRRTRFELARVRARHKITVGDQWDSAKAFAEAHRATRQVFTNGQFKTIFMPEYRYIGLNFADPRIAEGHHIALTTIRRMSGLAAEHNIRFLVLLIPTKELVFQPLWLNPSQSYLTLTKSEERFWRTTKEFLEQNSIEYVDSLPALRAQLQAGIQPYPASDDGHPNESGYKALAAVLAAHLKSS